MNAIVAVYSDWGIGDGGTQPIVLSADRKHFRELTSGAAVIVGRKTLEDFPGGKPLRGRHNIVVTRSLTEIEGAEVVRSAQEALEAAAKFENCFVIGGASIFEQFFPYTDRVYITKLFCRPESTRFFPDLDSDSAWSCVEASRLYEEDGVKYCFCTYERNK